MQVPEPSGQPAGEVTGLVLDDPDRGAAAGLHRLAR